VGWPCGEIASSFLAVPSEAFGDRWIISLFLIKEKEDENNFLIRTCRDFCLRGNDDNKVLLQCGVAHHGYIYEECRAA
jgi:hypothetical protein